MQGGVDQRETTANMKHMSASLDGIKLAASACRTQAIHESGFCPRCNSRNVEPCGGNGSVRRHSTTSAGPWVAWWFFRGRNPAAELRTHRRASRCRDSFPHIDLPPPPCISQHPLHFWLTDHPQKNLFSPTQPVHRSVCGSVPAH